MDFPDLVSEELLADREFFVPHRSLHESYAIILDRLEDCWAEIRCYPLKVNKKNVLIALVEIATVCQRAAEDNGIVKEVECLREG